MVYQTVPLFFGIVSICMPDTAFFSYLMVYMSFNLYYFSVVLAILFFLLRRLSILYIIFFTAVQILLNEKILKNIIRQDRPKGSCSDDYGMPSSHSLLDLFWVTWFVLEITIGTRKNLKLKNKILITFVVLLNTVLVPYSRYYLGYHTGLQIIIGSIMGFFWGLLNFFFISRYNNKMKKWLWSWRITKAFALIDDYYKVGENPFSFDSNNTNNDEDEDQENLTVNKPLLEKTNVNYNSSSSNDEAELN
ncbi:dolichyldiphosphatase 1 [Anaeramoeba flamelloides]|uniref:Dolichyldiphosphatase 1 n=1 Tax=Anaeramoeba flamelloides TaxID=1746091 RepID=A0ABQ8XSU2_9EUKA|nr:dolichyldiphosphatase 1 [Anaeramoeba flamelloides]